jgi:organic radical activating enzyme
MTTATTTKDYYCSQKFWWLSLDVEKLSTQSCCTATPHKIDIAALSTNPGQLFNSPTLLEERKQMLANIPVKSCDICWRAESQGISSRRTQSNSESKTHLNINSTPEILNIMIGSNCNLTCVYCCKQYSTAWFADINTNGTYLIDGSDDRFTINNKDRVLNQLSQKDLNKSDNVKKLLDEIQLMCAQSSIKKIDISGGEPFLYLYLKDLIKVLPSDSEIEIFTGLGVDEKRFAKELGLLAEHKNVTVSISAESIGDTYEFLRAGNSWKRFENNLKILQQYQIKYKFTSVLCNLSLINFQKFIQYIGDTEIRYVSCFDPDYLSINVMDDKSKEIIFNNINNLPIEAQNIIKSMIELPPTEHQRNNLKIYLTEFAKRRNLSLEIFPETFINWINHVV